MSLEAVKVWSRESQTHKEGEVQNEGKKPMIQQQESTRKTQEKMKELNITMKIMNSCTEEGKRCHQL